MRLVGRRRSSPDAAAPERIDARLRSAYGETLDAFDAAPDPAAGFASLDDELWALLLTRCYDGWPRLQAALPDVPDPDWQRIWNGTAGVALAEQSLGFYRLLREVADAHLGGLANARVLDFGCGWGRLTRFLARDVPPDRLFGCDAVPGMAALCREHRVPATLADSDPHSEELPFAEPFDLAFAYSVFTHLAEPAHRRALRALHRGLRPGGLLVVTVRPDDHLPGDEPYRFAPHPSDGHPQYTGGEMEYGEAVVTLDYVREHWDFTLLETRLQAADPQQVVLVLRREGGA